MPITEFATLLVSPTHTVLASKEVSPSSTLLAHLSQLSALQSSHSSFPLYFFTSTSTHQLRIILLSKWSNLEAHNTWIASSTNQELLRTLTRTFLEIEDFVHLDADLDLDRLFKSSEIWLEKVERGNAAPESEMVQGQVGEGIERNVTVVFHNAMGDQVLTPISVLKPLMINPNVHVDEGL